MPGAVYNRIFDLATEQYGFVTTVDAKQLGVDPNRLVVMAGRGLLDHRANGLYRVAAIPTTGLDSYMEATLWPRGRGILSHETALDLYDLSDINPAKIHITVPKAYRPRRGDEPPVYRIYRRDLDPADVASFEGIPIVTPRRAILDCIEIHVGPHLIRQAVEAGQRHGLIRTADVARIEEQVRIGRADEQPAGELRHQHRRPPVQSAQPAAPRARRRRLVADCAPCQAGVRSASPISSSRRSVM
jgi:predicted transcriptional regulator of viral defense system